jgi:hypothetical protein
LRGFQALALGNGLQSLDLLTRQPDCRALQHWREYALTPYVVKNAISFPFSDASRFVRNLLLIFRRSARCSATILRRQLFAASRANPKSGDELG